ncbi:NAD-dependent epimerase/dehydratase family protein [Sulfuriferula nivalis]|uniref:NAD-dependent epimerase n=1 Tax=Sulfuriferula nivalis TaxID=2675298 RepID=A0A809S7P1_9PROT|nr:NAD(P)-dependent oxidoreductase [Sulfuriferula nivalis]BBO99922.1 NAD-dependent epimerase [Sulfuriferula nivalis]
MSSSNLSSNRTTLVIIGASGFIGEHLLSVLAERNDIEIRVLVHSNRSKNHSNLSFIEGDMLNSDSLDVLLSKNCTVINLAYLVQDNLEAMANLANACVRNQILRLVHCSTAVVAGRVDSDWVTESTLCVPISEYEQTKLRMEEVLLELAIGKFEVTILRPTAVFGPDGKNLLKMANELMTKNLLINYAKSCLFNRRSMNLVCVENVVAALVFLLDAEKVDREIFIIADDDSPVNNYRDIENRLLTNFGKSYFVPRVFIPKFCLGALLRLAGKSNINPSIKYSDQKLVRLGFKKPQNLETAIVAFAAWYKNYHTSQSVGHVI